MFVQTDNFGYSEAFKCEYCTGRYVYPTHLHQYAEVIYVCEGELELTVGKTETVHSGEFAVIMPFQVHKLDSPATCKVWICVFSDVLISDFVKKNELIYGQRCVFTPDETTRNYVLKQLVSLKTSSLENDFDVSLFYRIKSGLFAIMEGYFASVPIAEKYKESDMFSRLILYVHTNYSEDLTLSSVASQLGYSANYISHYFKTVMHMNFCSFLNCIRVEKAKILLVSTRDSSVNIASLCGFSCERSFHRAFKNVTGMTPTQYRSQSKN